MKRPRALDIYSVGHSTRSLEEMIAILRAFGVEQLADVRTVPRSARNPQFNSDTFARALSRAGFGYAHLARLGGLRKPRPDSKNDAWRNLSFRGYADYMETADFATGLRELLELAERGSVALMCAEAVPWRCHRNLVSDALAARGIQVEHIMGETQSHPHRLTSFAELEDGRVSYPAAQST